ncbi:4'-phosphopantetheinyl transferase family protein [Streptomyces sp. NPDC091272]|uniref:4'-phosphopantetheinyl transferase family protein n=1 Tax=Streptomyces sp. NPDC091272 TaxID=3365981 RepID=UPI0038154E0D
MPDPSPLRAPRTLLPGALAGEVLPRPQGAPDVWQLRTSEYYAQAGGDAASEILDAAERKRFAAFRRQSDQESYGAAHVGLRRLLGAYLDQDPAAVVLGREDCPLCPEPHGRPCVPGSHLHFSLSHSGDLVLFAFGPTPVGVDVELVPGVAQTDEVATTLHPRERAELAALGADDTRRRAAFGRCWCRKEAYFKGTGTGLAAPIDGTYVGTGPRPGDIDGWQLTDLTMPEGYAAAMAHADST